MNEIIHVEFLSPDVKLFRIKAGKIAKKRKAGQFVILRVHKYGERIPITIADSDPDKGTITLIVQGIGKTTKLMNTLESGDYLHDLVGPLGKPTDIEKYGLVVCMSGGVGTAEAYPIARSLKDAGNDVISIIGARSRELVIMENEMRQIVDEVIITTDDGSYGLHGFVTDALKSLLIQKKKPDFILAIGPMPMMKAVAKMTEPLGIKTMVSLNSIMIDGTGMCGGCRATVAGKTVFVCVDGPEFDAHQVNFDELIRRQRAYLSQEKISLEMFLHKKKSKNHECKLDKEMEKIGDSY
jgi:ferredoxin--NADP+ reductase